MNQGQDAFRFEEARSSFSSDEIFSAAHTDGEIAVPLTPKFSVFKKLEVVDSRRINFIARVYKIVALVALLASTTIIILARTVFSQFFEDLGDNFPDLRVYAFPKSFTMIDFVLFVCMSLYALVLLIIFSFVMAKQKEKVILSEQVWVFLLLLATVIYLIPYEASVRLRRDYFELPVPVPEDGFNIIDAFVCLRVVSFAFIYILYLWFGTHGYRYLTSRVSVRDWTFYIPKIAIVSVYVIYKLCMLFIYRVVFSEMPFVSFVGFIRLYAAFGQWPRLGVISAVVLTVLELIIAFWVGLDIYKTSVALQNAEYVENRTKILGFRFFLHQQLVFNFVYIATYVLILFGLPNGAQLLLYAVNSSDSEGRGSYFDVPYAPFGLNLSILAFASIEAYTNLPADISLRRVLLGCTYAAVDDEKSIENFEPVVYRNKEPPSFSGSGVEPRPNCFVMQTTVELFNLSWFVYYHGTKKETRLESQKGSLPVKISDFIYDKATDTRAIIAETADRIIVVFKGTSSTQNLRTDIKLTHRSLSQVIGKTNICGQLGENMGTGKSKLFEKAKIHAGFAVAYDSIKDHLRHTLLTFFREKKRPVFFTGHSLGGALATLSSIDALVSLQIPGPRIVVATFGSPRVGNEAFQEFYDSKISMNWRVVAGGDMISRLPKLGYRHVGKKVILTSTGELFIDPSELDMIFWHAQSASIVHHRKACYLLAIKAWCESLETDYVPDFWPFPVSENDSRKFVTTFQKPISRRLNDGPGSRHTFRKRRANQTQRLQMFADAIDALDGGSEEYSESIVSQWETLTLRMIHRFHE